jgi:hypothetical protein
MTGSFLDVDWINLSQGRVKVQAVVNTVMNLRAESFLPNLATAAFSGRPGGGGCMELVL